MLIIHSCQSVYWLHTSLARLQCTIETFPLAVSIILSLQVSDDANVILNGFGTVVNSLKMRAKPYLPQICGTIKWRLNNKNAKIRQQAADLIARIAIVMKVHLP